MKGIFKGTLFSALLVFGCLSVYSAEVPEPRLITVVGEAEVKAVPNEVVFTLGVETLNRSIKIAKKQNDDNIKGIIASAKANGIETKDIQTDFVSIQQEFDYNRGKIFTGYSVKNRVVITLKDISKYDVVLDEMLKAGANYLYGIEFNASELKRYKQEARLKAVKNAKEKADALAGELGEKVGRVYRINEYPGESPRPLAKFAMMRDAAMTAGGGETIAPGELSINSKVEVSFELKP